MEEIWKDIPGYEGYYKVSSMGRVKSLEREIKYTKRQKHGFDGMRVRLEKILKPASDARGYKFVRLYHHCDKPKILKVHRLVLLAFDPEHDPSKDQVNHINGLTSDNRLENLEWCSGSENQLHAVHVLKKYPTSISSSVRCVETGMNYRSTLEAQRQTGIHQAVISSSARRGHLGGGYHWEYIQKATKKTFNRYKNYGK